MASPTLDLLLKEIKDPYVQENFHKLKRYLDCLEVGVAGPRGIQGPAGAPGDDAQEQKHIMNVPASTSVGDLVYQDYTQLNFANVFVTNDSPSPFIGVITSKETTTTACVQLQGILDTALGEGPVFVGETGELQIGYPASGPWQRMGFSFGDGKLWLEPKRERIRGC